MSDLENMKSSYMKYLPSIFRGTDEEKAGFLERYLKVFEKILTGIDDSKYLPEKLWKYPSKDDPRYRPDEPREGFSFAETLGSISDFFYPDTAQEEFIDWIANWAGLVLREDWSLKKKKDIIKNIIPLYRLRGTKRGLEEFIRIYVGGGVEIKDIKGSFPVGFSKIGIDTIIGGQTKPYFFMVDVQLPEINARNIYRSKKNIEEILNAEKPMHTNYILNLTIPTMQIGVRGGCVVGENTLLGGTTTEIK